MISVDDLIRQRLAGGEEKERDGSWGRMRELLDKEMPQQKAVGIGWSRPFMYAGMLLLGSALSWGGYQLYNGQGARNSGIVAAMPSGQSASAVASGNAPIDAGESAIGSSSASAPTGSTGSNIQGSKGRISSPAGAGAPSSAGTAMHGNNDTHGIQNNHGKGLSEAAISTGATESPVAAHALATASKSAGQSRGSVGGSAHRPEASGSSIGGHSTGSGAHNNTHAPLVAAGATAINHASTTTQSAQQNGNQSIATHVLGSAAKAGNATKHTSHTLQSASGLTGHEAKSGHEKGMHTASAVGPVSGKSKAKVEETIAVDKVVLNKRYVHDEAGGHYKFDTISKEKLYEQLHAVAGIINTTIGNVTQDGVMEHAVASNGNALTPATSLPLASSSSTAPSLKAASEAKSAKEIAKQSGGSKLLTNLSTAFNDIKMSAKGSQFTCGLTGGINGAFFGPANFYGFDFGVSGTMNINDNVGIVSELKYFHRINSGYEFNDDYYVYESNNGAGGGWKKSKIDYDYSFSTLHSLELPLYIKYSVANFSFFGGANLSYIFGINTSAAPLPDPKFPAQIVAAKGNDDHATVNYSDFGQRFGIGYLFGIAFKLSPTVSLDLRSAQNCWDNLKASGAKTVSTTLYNTPSTQISLNFRLGAPKKESVDK